MRHFDNKGYGETDVRLHMDNCKGQNKSIYCHWVGINNISVYSKILYDPFRYAYNSYIKP